MNKPPAPPVQRSYHIKDPSDHGTQSVSVADEQHRPFADLRGNGAGAGALLSQTAEALSYPVWDHLTSVRRPAHSRPSFLTSSSPKSRLSPAPPKSRSLC